MGLFDIFFGNNKNENVSNGEVENISDSKLSSEKKNILERAIESEGLSLENETYELRNDKDFIIELLKSEKKISIKDISEELKDDKEVILLSIKCDPNNFLYASYELRNTEEVVLTELKYNHGKLSGKEGDSILNNYDFMVNVIREYDWENIKFSSSDLRNNKDFCREAAKKNYESINYFGDSVRLDTEFMNDIKVYM